MLILQNLKKMNKSSILSSLLLCLTLCIFSTGKAQSQGVEQNMYKFGRLLRLVDSFYTDTTNIPSLTEKAIVGMLTELDPHSVYIPKSEVEAMNEPLEGGFFGIGISFNIFKDTLMVVTTIPGGPSEKVGLRASDRILEVDGKWIAKTGIKNNDVFKMLKGEKGTIVKLKIKRKGTVELLDFTIVRDKIPLHSLDASYMLNKHTGYIKLNRFSGTTTEEFLEAVKTLKSNPDFKDLVLDLRGNGGGYLNAAYELADHFLEGKKLIVYTEGNKSPRKDYESSVKGELEQGKVVVLIDEGSASASEILAGAIQDWDRGLVIGRRSYGKGLVQQQYYLTDGSMVRLTTAHYYTPSGRCIQRPYQDGVDEYRMDQYKRFENGELFSEDSIHLNKKERYSTRLNARTVYGGGGIMPDLFIPLDTSIHYRYYNELLRKNLIYDKVLTMMDKSREKFKKKYPTFEKYMNEFEVEDAVIDEIVAKGEEEGIKKKEESIAFARPQMKQQIKGLIARDLFEVSRYYQIMNTDDKTILKAIEVIENTSIYNKLLAESK